MPVQMASEICNATLSALNKRHGIGKSRGAENRTEGLACLYRIDLYVLTGKVFFLIILCLCPFSHLFHSFGRPGILKFFFVFELFLVLPVLKEFVMVQYLHEFHFFLRISFHVGLFTVISMSRAKTGKPSKP